MSDYILSHGLTRRQFLKVTGATTVLAAIGAKPFGSKSTLVEVAAAPTAPSEGKWSPTACWVGKQGCILNARVVNGVGAVVTAFVVPLFLALMSFGIASPGLFLAVLALGAVGLASASTFIAAIVAKTAAKGALFAVLATPLLLPPLVAAVTATRVAATEPALSAGLDAVQLLFAYDGLMVTVSFLLFDAVWHE